MQLVGPGLQSEARKARARSAVFGRGVKRGDLELPYRVLREAQFAKCGGFAGLGNDRAVQVKFSGARLAPTHGGGPVAFAETSAGAEICLSAARYTGSQDHEDCGTSLFSLPY